MNWLPGIGWPIPPHAETITWDEWIDRMLRPQFETQAHVAARQLTPMQRFDALHGRAVATARDRYGWRGLKGTSFIGRQA